MAAFGGLVAGVALTVSMVLSGATLGASSDHKVLARATRAENELAALRESVASMRARLTELERERIARTATGIALKAYRTAPHNPAHPRHGTAD